MRPSGTIALLGLAACSLRGSGGEAPGAPTSDVAFVARRGGASIRGATVQSEIAYAPTSRAQTFDLYLPQTGAKPYPVIVRLHGGSFHTGSARMEEQGVAAERTVAAGYALVAVNYRLAEEAPFPAAARDAKAAVRFLRANAARWDLDASRIAAWGESSGAWLAIMLGVTGDQPTLFDDPSLGNAEVSSAVQAVVDWYGPTNYLRLDAQQAEHPPVACLDTYQHHAGRGTLASTWLCGDGETRLIDPSCAPKAQAANLLGYIATARTIPPFAIAHGADDCEIAWWQSVELLEALKKREVVTTFMKVPRSGHADVQVEASETQRALDLLAKAFHPVPVTDD